MRVLAVLAALAGCYQAPSGASCKYTCGGASNTECPGDLTCAAGRCVKAGESCLDDGGVIDAPPDDSGIDGPMSACPGLAVLQKQLMDLDAENDLQSLAAFDANGDGTVDIVVGDGVNNASAIGTFPGAGDGTFGARIGSPGEAAHVGIAVGRLNGDLIPDMVTILRNAGGGVHLAASTGVFGFAANFSTIGDPTDVELVDVNGDQHLDLFIAAGATVHLFEGTGGGAFQSRGMVTSTSGISGIAVARIDLTDQFFDLAVAGEVASHVAVHQGTGTGAFSFGGPQTTGVGIGPDDLAFGTLRNGSSELSLVTTNRDDSNVTVLHATSTGKLTIAGSFDTHDLPEALVLVDIDLDGDNDIVTANALGTLTVLANDGDADFVRRDVTHGGGTAPIALAAGDFDGDHRPDIAVANGGTNTVSIFLNRCPPP